MACFAELNSKGTISSLRSHNIYTIGEGTVRQREKMLAEWAVAQWEAADIIIGHNVKAFDQKFLQGAMLRHRIRDGILPPRIILDTYQIGKGWFGMSMSMANLVDVLGLGAKDAPHKEDWREANAGDPEAVRRITERCVSDVRLTAKMWNVLKPLYFRKFGK